MVTRGGAVAVLVRPGTKPDLGRLAAIELDAGQRFRAIGMPIVAEQDADPLGLLAALAAQRLWVAQVGPQVVGYVSAGILDECAHVEQVSVACTYAGRGIGRRLMEVVEAAGRGWGCPATTLTTFRDVPWNAPYYVRLGYVMITETEVGPELSATMDREARRPGTDPRRRCAMMQSNVGPRRRTPPNVIEI